MLRRILVGFDASPQARRALRVAMDMAEGGSGEVAVVGVVSHDRGETDEDRAAAFDADARPLRQQAEHDVASHPYGPAHTIIDIVGADNPARALDEIAHDHGYDVIVVGRHGHEQASHVGIGRISRQLAENARCPVLIVGDDR